MKYTSDMFNEISACNNEMLDLSSMSFIDAAKTVMMVSAFNSCSNVRESIKCKVSSSKMEDFLSDLPVTKPVEFVY